MELWKAAILGIVQGLTEFLPVSSSGHLILFERILGVDTEGADLFLGVMLHAGTLAAVLFVYASRLWEMIRFDRKKIVFLLLATLPAALIGVLFGDWIDGIFFGGDFLWIAFAATAVLLLLSDAKIRRGGLLRPVGYKSSLIMGGAQALAVIPGLSRSCTTLAAGVLSGLSREDAADFSFLMSIPVIAGALLVEIWKAFRGGGSVAAISWQSLAAGTLCAALFGFISIRWMLRTVKQRRLVGFSVYLFILAAVLAVLQSAF